jgi:hypothetical protein
MSTYTSESRNGHASAEVPCPPSDLLSLQRTRYFPGQLVGPDAFTQDQIHLRGKHRRHNRLLHGWGVVCGARVRSKRPETCEVEVEPGYILGPYGDEIVIEDVITVDLCREDLSGNAIGTCGDDVDPWCTDVRVPRRSGEVYLAIAYAECPTRPVRVDACGCGCDDADCEYSQIRDSYVFRVLTELPSSYDPMPRPDMRGIFSCTPPGPPSLRERDDPWCEPSRKPSRLTGRTCPPCPEEPWVILADVKLSGETIADIDCYTHRRYVASFAGFYFRCTATRSDKGFQPIEFREEASVARAYYMTAGAAEAPENARTAEAGAAVRLMTGEWAVVTGEVAVVAGETTGEFLAREGEREVVAPNGETYRLRDLYAAAGASPEERLERPEDALAALEGARLDVESVRVIHGRLDEFIDPNSMETFLHERLGNPSAAADLPAAALRPVAEEPLLAKAVTGRTVREIADSTPDELSRAAVGRRKKVDRAAVDAAAAAAHGAARTITRLAAAWDTSSSKTNGGR